MCEFDCKCLVAKLYRIDLATRAISNGATLKKFPSTWNTLISDDPTVWKMRCDHALQSIAPGLEAVQGRSLDPCALIAAAQPPRRSSGHAPVRLHEPRRGLRPGCGHARLTPRPVPRRSLPCRLPCSPPVCEAVSSAGRTSRFRVHADPLQRRPSPHRGGGLRRQPCHPTMG
jgi:hypothetical protein